jgi:hypothetical protein
MSRAAADSTKEAAGNSSGKNQVTPPGDYDGRQRDSRSNI